MTYATQDMTRAEIEAAQDTDAVKRFSQMMLDKMNHSRVKGRGGWMNPNECSVEYLRKLLFEHLWKGDPVDVANICMMLRHYDANTTPNEATCLTFADRETAQANAAAEQMRERCVKAMDPIRFLSAWFGGERYARDYEYLDANFMGDAVAAAGRFKSVLRALPLHEVTA